MTKIVVFDSGLGSLSIIKPIQKKVTAEIIYFADKKNFPYGTKSVGNLKKILKSTIIMLEEKFHPDLIVVGSNTPSLLLKNFFNNPKIIGVYPQRVSHHLRLIKDTDYFLHFYKELLLLIPSRCGGLLEMKLPSGSVMSEYY